MRNQSLIVLFTALLILGCASPVLPPSAEGPTPTPEQLAWHEMEQIAFIHFTINTFTDKEWGFGNESPDLFNPSELDAEQWVRVLKETGFKGVILTCKHHDGFSLWPTKYSEHNIAKSPYKGGNGDIVREVSEACKKYGLKFGVYLSPWDRNRADYGEPSYVEYYRNQLRELFTSYGNIYEMWFDGANGGDGYYGGANEIRQIDRRNYYDWPSTLDLVKDLQPGVIFFSDAGPDVRWGGNERAEAGTTNWHTINTDTLYAGKFGIESLLNTGSEKGTHWVPLEANTSIRPGWFYHASEDSLVKSPEQLFETYLTSVGRSATLLLNVPPDRRGLFHENDIASLKGWQALLKKEFNLNLADNASVSASSYRGNSPAYAGKNVTDNNSETYWGTDDGTFTGSLEIHLGESKEVKYVLLQEYIQLGQRIKNFEISVWNGKTWDKVAAETTIGYKRIVRLDNPVHTEKIKVTVTDSKACPLISTIEIY